MPMPIFKRTMLQLLVGALLFSTPELAAGLKADGVPPPGQPQHGGVTSIIEEAPPVPPVLGRFSMAPYDGTVVLTDWGNDLRVDVGVYANVVGRNPATLGRGAVPSEKIEVWVLLEEGKVAAPHEKSVESCRVGCTAQVSFTFEKPAAPPLAVVLKFDDQFQAFPVHALSK
jgi:hypothetical protein